MAQIVYRVIGRQGGKRVSRSFFGKDPTSHAAARKAFIASLDGSGKRKATFKYDVRTRIGGRVVTQTFDTKQEADGYADEVGSAKHRGTAVDPRAGRQRLSDYARDWLTGRTDLRPTTTAKYRYLLESHILPELGAFTVAGIAPSNVRAWYMTLRERLAVTADDAYRLLRAILNTATADGVIGRSPCQVKGAGQVRSPERPTASVAEVVAAVEAIPERYRLAVLLPAWCQLRRGEVLGLQRGDVDLLYGTVAVERAWTAPMGAAPVLGPPKTEAGRRTLALPPNILDALQDHLERFVGPAPDAWLFATATGSALSPRNLNRAWLKARVAAGRPDLHLHDLRHSGLTWAAASGASVAELMRRGGHANPRAALRYQHATADRDRAIADALGALAELATIPARDRRAMGTG